MGEANFVRPGNEEKVTLASALDGGDIVQCDSGRVGVLSGGNQTYAAGDVVVADTEGVFDVVSASATLFSAGDTVGFDDTNKLAVDHGDGDFNIGLAAESKSSGTTRVQVVLNARKDEAADETESIADPGDAGAIPVNRSGFVNLVTAGPETRTIAAPTFEGQSLQLNLQTDGGDCVITVATTVNQTGNNTLTAADAGDHILLQAGRSGASLVWRVVANDGVALATV